MWKKFLISPSCVVHTISTKLSTVCAASCRKQTVIHFGTEKNPREKNACLPAGRSRRFKVSRSAEASRLQGSGLPSGRQPQAVIAIVIPVAVDEHATLVDNERGVAAVGEYLTAAAPVVLKKIVAGLLETNEQSGCTEGNRGDVFPGQKETLLLGKVLPVAVSHWQSHSVDTGCQLRCHAVVLVVPVLLMHQLLAGITVTQVLQRPVTDTDHDLTGRRFGKRFRTRLSEAEDCHGIVGEGRKSHRPRICKVLHGSRVCIQHGQPPLRCDSCPLEPLETSGDLLLRQPRQTCCGLHRKTPLPLKWGIQVLPIPSARTCSENETSALGTQNDAQRACLFT